MTDSNHNDRPEKTGTEVLLMPVFNDWVSVQQLLTQLDKCLTEAGRSTQVLLVDDGSSETSPLFFDDGQFLSISHVSVIRLARNIGHQRAICIGVAYIEQNFPDARMAVMDSDGEDDPAELVKLLQRADEENNQSVVFGARLKRSESLLFRFCYHLYRLVHWIIVGQAVRVGNFSVVPNRYLSALTTSSDLWNHYAATIYSSRIPFVLLPTQRAKRLDGHSRMNFVSLVVHGLSAISVFSERIGARLLAAIVPLCFLTLVGLASVVLIRTLTVWAVPGWATAAAGLLLVILLQLVFLSVVFTFIVLNSRTQMSFLPVRDYEFFIIGAEDIYPRRALNG